MKHILHMLKGTIRRINSTLVLGLMCLLFFTSVANAQFTQRKSWSGNFQIRMTASANLQPVFLNATQAAGSKLLADSLITDATIIRSGTRLDMNNQFKGGSPFQQIDIPKPALACKTDPNQACTSGYFPVATTSSCPTKKFSDSDADILKQDVYVSMTYADYDTDLSTYSSSMAELRIPSCSRIENAYLYWAGNYSTGNSPITLVPGPLNTYDETVGGVLYNQVFNNIPNTPINAGGFDRVKFKVPGGAYQDVNAVTRYTTNRAFICVADVTAMVKAGSKTGQYWVGNLKSYPNDGDGGSTSGWTLVVVYEDPLSPPQSITLQDGTTILNAGNTTDINLPVTVPATGPINAYVGFGMLDAEDVSNELLEEGKTPSSFQVNGVSMNQMSPYLYKNYTNKGYPANSSHSAIMTSCKEPQFDNTWNALPDGYASSQITSYNPLTGTNGNQITRLPDVRNTLGYDAHHIKLNSGMIANGATNARLTLMGTQNGSCIPFFAYVAVETIVPDLIMTKIANKTTTNLGSQIEYTLRVKNTGNAPTTGNQTIKDALDISTDYSNAPLVATRYVNGLPPSVATDVTLVSSANDNLEINIANAIDRDDSIDITFTVNVTTDPTAFNPPTCKKAILNTAFITYNNGSGVITKESNSSECGIDSTTKVLVIDPLITGSTSTKLGPFDACSLETADVITTVQQELVNSGIASALIPDFDIMDENLSTVNPGDVFGLIIGSKKYIATRDLSTPGSCQQVYELEFECNTFTEVFIPNLITPGKDSKNDVFEIVNLLPKSSLKIYNRWGKLVYSSNDYDNKWKPEGKENGVYFYYFTDSVKKKNYKGWLQVINED